MEDIQEVKCFQHCDRQTNILIFCLPYQCPLCGQDILTTESRIPPYKIPSPFVDARSQTFSIVIRPTAGTFLRDYLNDSNLHIGVTNSKGEVYDFDEEGIHINSPLWNQCVPVPMVDNKMDDMCQNWDKILTVMSQSDLWRSVKYDENSYNCFDFVISFLHQTGHQTAIGQNRTTFCEEFILPHTTKAAKYISIYRHIDQHGYICQNVGVG